MDNKFSLKFNNGLGLLVIIGIFTYFFLHPDPSVVETLKSALLLLVGFYWGSSSGSARKDDTIRELQNKPSGGATIVENSDSVQAEHVETVNTETTNIKNDAVPE